MPPTPSDDASPSVIVQDLVVRYGPTVAVDGISFEAHAGAITVVLGGVVMVAVYFGGLVILRNAEIRSAVDLVRARLGR